MDNPKESLNMTTLQGQVHFQGVCSNEPAITGASPRKEEGVRIHEDGFKRGTTEKPFSRSLFPAMEQQAL